MEKQPGLRVFPQPGAVNRKMDGQLKTGLKSLQSDVSNHSRGLMGFGKSLVALGDMSVSKVWAHVNKEADGASKLWTKSTLMKVLYHGVTADAKWALRLLKGGRAIFPLGKNLRQKGGLVGSGFGSELSKTSEERGGVFPNFLEFCLIQKSCLNPVPCQFPWGEVGRTGIYRFIQPLIMDLHLVVSKAKGELLSPVKQLGLLFPGPVFPTGQGLCVLFP